jgi:hypothetical protein
VFYCVISCLIRRIPFLCLGTRRPTPRALFILGAGSACRRPEWQGIPSSIPDSFHLRVLRVLRAKQSASFLRPTPHAPRLASSYWMQASLALCLRVLVFNLFPACRCGKSTTCVDSRRFQRSLWFPNPERIASLSPGLVRFRESLPWVKRPKTFPLSFAGGGEGEGFAPRATKTHARAFWPKSRIRFITFLLFRPPRLFRLSTPNHQPSEGRPPDRHQRP